MPTCGRAMAMELTILVGGPFFKPRSTHSSLLVAVAETENEHRIKALRASRLAGFDPDAYFTGRANPSVPLIRVRS